MLFRSQEKANEDWWLTKSTIWLAAWTAVLAVFTFLLWFATRKLVIDAKDTSKVELRAYLGFGKVEVVPLSHEHIQAIIEIKNSGATPAHGVTHTIRGEIRDATNAFNFPDQHTDRGPTIVAPGASIFVRFT